MEQIQQQQTSSRLSATRNRLAMSVLRLLGPFWRGPAFTIELPHQGLRAKVGQGEPHTELIIKGSCNLWELLSNGSLMFGEAYMKGDVIVHGSLMDILQGYHQSAAVLKGIRLFLRRSRPSRDGATAEQAVANAQHHYDIGNDFYKLWLDPSLTYSCAYFPTGKETLAEAQFAKRELICKKLKLDRPNLTMLDIGCGWGSLLFHAAERYGANTVGITPAVEQANYVRQEAARRGLTDQVKVIVGDWRSLKHKPYDRLVSIGMFEHVGEAQYANFFKSWHALLKPEGISLLHTIGILPPSTVNPWIDTYIFPGGRLPTEQEITSHATAADLRLLNAEEERTLPEGIHGWQNLRPHYATTLRHWSQNAAAAQPQIESMFDKPFYRMWQLYLQGSEAGFRWGALQLYQVILLGPKAHWAQTTKNN